MINKIINFNMLNYAPVAVQRPDLTLNSRHVPQTESDCTPI